MDASFYGLLVSWLGQLAAGVRDPEGQTRTENIFKRIHSNLKLGSVLTLEILFEILRKNQLSRIHLAVQIEEQFVVEVKVCEAGIDHRDDCQPYRLCFLDRIIMSKEIKNQIGY